MAIVSVQWLFAEERSHATQLLITGVVYRPRASVPLAMSVSARTELPVLHAWRTQVHWERICNFLLVLVLPISEIAV
jgi:hypothetical protein